MEKTREEFIVFIRQALHDRASGAFEQLYRFLVGCYVKADFTMTGKVRLSRFDTLIESAAALPRLYGFAPRTSEMYLTEAHRRAARARLFEELDTQKCGYIKLGQWIPYAMQHIAEKVVGLSKDYLGGSSEDVTKEEFVAFCKKAMDKNSPEYRELYFFLVKTFEKGDEDHCGSVGPMAFDQMIEDAAEAPRRFGLAPATDDLYPNAQARFAARKAFFDKMDVDKNGTITLNEWIDYAYEHICGKIASLAVEKTKEEFVVFIRQALHDRSSGAFEELYKFLVKNFTRADVKMTGKVDLDGFDKLIESAAGLPRMYGFAPKTHEMYPNDVQRRQAREKLFKELDTRDVGYVTLGQWIPYALQHIAEKIEGLPRDHLGGTNQEVTKEEFIEFAKKAMVKDTPEYKELYHFLVKTFQKGDVDKVGAVGPMAFDLMIEDAAEAPRRFGLAPATDDLFPNAQARFAARKHYFDQMDVNKNGTISLDEWINYAYDHIWNKVAPLAVQKTKEEFVVFIRQALHDRSSGAYEELYRFLVQSFTRADNTMDGKVHLKDFDVLIEAAASVPRLYGFAPKTSDMYNTENQKKAKKKKVPTATLR